MRKTILYCLPESPIGLSIDPDSGIISGTMSYSATGLPTGLSLNSSSGLISGTLASSDASGSPYSVTVTANDGTSSSSQTFAWTVSAINLTPLGDQTNNDGDTVSLSLTTGYHGTGTLSYTATGLPPGLSISSTTGQITGTITGTADTNSPYSVTVTATDGTNTASQTFNWTVNAVVSINSIGDQSNADGDAVSLQVSASDALNNTMTYSATNLPTGLTISSTTGLISGTIALGDDTSSPYAVTVTATDSAGLSASQTFNWTVASVGLANPGPQASVDNQAVSLALQGSSGATYTATGLPSGLSISSSGLISGTLASSADMSSPYVVTATATLGSNSTSQSFLWTVTPVGLATVSDQTNTEGDNVSLQLQGMSNGGSLTYSASGLPDGLSLNSTTGLITGTIVAGDAANGPYTVDVSVSNGSVSASQSFNWTVNPVVNLTAPVDQSNNEGDVVSLQLSATDSLNNALTYSATGLPPGLSINTTGLISGTVSTGDAANGPYAATVTASDGTYSSSTTFTWNVAHADTTALTMTAPGSQSNVAGDSVNLQINASDPDGIDTLTYTATGLPDGLSIDPYLGTITGTVADDAVSTTPYAVTVTATDGNGQSVSQTFSWLVNAAPITAQASPVSAVEGNDTGSLTVATFTTLDLNSQASDFTATVNWGDGSSPDVIGVSGVNGSFTVTDDYTYAELGNYPVSITITNDVTGATATASNTATVTAAPLTLTGGFDLGVLASQSPNLTLATFASGNPNLMASDFTATINWGDGSGNFLATVSDNDGVFTVSGNHAYAQNGAYTATITVTGTDGATKTTTSTVTVGDLYAGIQSNLTVASFTDGDTSALASSFTATINWGDGSSSSGTVTGGNGVFSIQGTHTYAVDSIDQPGGVYALTVTVSDASGNTLTSNGTVAVVRPPMTLDAGNVQTPLNIMTLNDVQVAAFTVPDATDGTGEFSATIFWGDNSSSGGTIQEVSPGLFEVLGTHAYAVGGIYPITVYIDQGWLNMFAAAAAVPQGQAGNGPDTWKPVVAGNLASNPDNWTYHEVPNGIRAAFDGNVSNARIVWDKNISPSSIILQNGYTGQQILNAGVTINSANGIDMGAQDQLNIDFKDTKSTLEMDGGTSTLTNFGFSGANGTFLINGATVNIADGDYFERTSATIKVTGTPSQVTGFPGKYIPAKLGKLNIGNTGTLVINGDNVLLIAYLHGIVKLDGGGEHVMILARGKGSYLFVDGGDLKWTGVSGKEDTINIPVVIAADGQSTLNGNGRGKEGGTLIVSGQYAKEGNVSWYMSSGATDLSNYANLEVSYGYKQTGGVLETIDGTKIRISALRGITRRFIFSDIDVVGGFVQIDTSVQSVGEVGPGPRYAVEAIGTLVLVTKNFNMAGTLEVAINAASAKKSDVLNVVEGPANILKGSVLSVDALGEFPQQGQSTWTILTSTGNTNLVQFATEHLPNGMTSKIVFFANKNEYDLIR